MARNRKPARAAAPLRDWFKLAREFNISDERNRLQLGQPLIKALVIRVTIDKRLLPALKACARANVLVWNRALDLSINGLPRKEIIARAMAARKKDTGALAFVSSGVIYATGWCASLMRKAIDPKVDPREKMLINPNRRAFMLARQGCTIERGEIKFPGVGYLKIVEPNLFDRFYSLHGRWTALVVRGDRLYVVIDAPAPIELLRHERTDYNTRLEAVHDAYAHRTKKDPLGRRASARMPLLAKFGKRKPEQDAAPDV